MMKYLPFVSALLILGACSKRIQQANVPVNTGCLQSAVPAFSSSLYDASIDVVGHHISGLLFVKVMPDSSQRVVFSNETGLTFFDFEWSKTGSFTTHYVMSKLKKRIVLNTLRNDLELMVIPESIRKSISIMESDASHQYRAFRDKETLLFNINPDCQSITSIEVMKKNEKVGDAVFYPPGKNVPDSVHIAHHNFNMKISLKRIER